MHDSYHEPTMDSTYLPMQIRYFKINIDSLTRDRLGAEPLPLFLFQNNF